MLTISFKNVSKTVAKTVVILLCTLVLISNLCGCNDESSKDSSADGSSSNVSESLVSNDDSSTSELVNDSNESKSEFDVNKLLYEGTYVKITCSKILKTGIEFEVENLSDSEILVSLNIGLDGVRYSSWGEANDWTIGAHETKTCIQNGNQDLNYVEHSYMSLYGNVFVNSSGVENFSVCDAELGGSEHLELELNDGIEQFSNDNLMVKYIDADAQGLNFYVENKRDVSIMVTFESLAINDEDQVCGNAMSVPPHTKTIFTLDILTYNPEYFSNDLEYFFGIMFTQIEGKDLADRFPVSYGIETEETSKESQNSEPVDAEETVNEKSNVETAYEKACSLTINDLKEKYNSFSGKNYYYYGDLIIQTEDAEWLTESWNTEKSLNQGALYRTIASYLQGFSNGVNTGESYCEIMCGIKWTSKEDFAPYAENASTFICAENSFDSIIRKLESLSCVSGDFDYENQKYHIVIPDLSECANEMMISEKMLGYIFAMMQELAPTISFDGNSCIIDY